MSEDGTALTSFTDFVTATKPKKITPTTEILNDTARNYYLLGDMLKGRGDEEVVQNGQYIQDMVRLSKHNAAGFYKPNQNLQPRGMNILTTLKCYWRFHQGNYAWTDEQVDLNGGNALDNWVRLITAWRQACQQDIWDSLEASLLADPDSTTEAADGESILSILAFITDDGLAPSGFTTVMGVNPATEANWRNQVETYTAATYATTINPAFDRMWFKLNWESPSSSQEWFTNTEWRKFKIITDLNGITKYLDNNRNSNDRLTPMNDPGTYTSNPTYANIPLKRINTLDEKSWSNSKYLWIDGRFIFPVFHTTRYMEELDPIRGSILQPFSWAVYTRTYLNLFCRSRKRQGIIVAG